jgi:hypothetical protein
VAQTSGDLRIDTGVLNILMTQVVPHVLNALALLTQCSGIARSAAQFWTGMALILTSISSFPVGDVLFKKGPGQAPSVTPQRGHGMECRFHPRLTRQGSRGSEWSCAARDSHPALVGP